MTHRLLAQIHGTRAHEPSGGNSARRFRGMSIAHSSAMQTYGPSFDVAPENDRLDEYAVYGVAKGCALSAKIENAICAIPVSSDGEGKDRLGPLTQLPAGTLITIRGAGLNGEMVRVSANEQCYFVFLQDLERSYAQAAHA